jgi:hypothetical protein
VSRADNDDHEAGNHPVNASQQLLAEPDHHAILARKNLLIMLAVTGATSVASCGGEVEVSSAPGAGGMITIGGGTAAGGDATGEVAAGRDSGGIGAAAREGGGGGAAGSGNGGQAVCPTREGEAPCVGEEAMCEQAAEEREKELLFWLELPSEREGTSPEAMERNWDCVVEQLEADGVDIPTQDGAMDRLVVISAFGRVENALRLEAVTGFGVECTEELCESCWELELDECEADAFCFSMLAFPFEPDRQCVAISAPVAVGCTPFGSVTDDNPCVKRLADGALFIAAGGSAFRASPEWGECSEAERRRLAVHCEDD